MSKLNTWCENVHFMMKRSKAHDQHGESKVMSTLHGCAGTFPGKEGGIQV